MIWLIIYLIMINASTVLSQAVGINNLFTAVFGCLIRRTASVKCIRGSRSVFNTVTGFEYNSVRLYMHSFLL